MEVWGSGGQAKRSHQPIARQSFAEASATNDRSGLWILACSVLFQWHDDWMGMQLRSPTPLQKLYGKPMRRACYTKFWDRYSKAPQHSWTATSDVSYNRK